MTYKLPSKDFYGDIAMEEDESLTPYSRAEQEFEKDFTQQERTDLAAKTNETYSDPNLTLDEKEVITEIKNQLAGFKVPKEVKFVEQLPRNAMGKVQKNILRNLYA